MLKDSNIRPPHKVLVWRGKMRWFITLTSKSLKEKVKLTRENKHSCKGSTRRTDCITFCWFWDEALANLKTSLHTGRHFTLHSPIYTICVPLISEGAWNTRKGGFELDFKYENFFFPKINARITITIRRTMTKDPSIFILVHR